MFSTASWLFVFWVQEVPVSTLSSLRVTCVIYAVRQIEADSSQPVCLCVEADTDLICCCGTGNQMAFPCSCVRPPATSGVPVPKPLEDFHPNASERRTLLCRHWWNLTDWLLALRNRAVINLQPCWRHSMMTWCSSFMLFFCLLSCQASLQPISTLTFSPLSPLVSSHRTLTSKSGEEWECSCHIQLLLSCSFKALSKKKNPQWTQWRKSMLVTGGLLELRKLLAGFVISWGLLDWLYLSPQDCYFVIAALSCIQSSLNV